MLKNKKMAEEFLYPRQIFFKNYTGILQNTSIVFKIDTF